MEPFLFRESRKLVDRNRKLVIENRNKKSDSFLFSNNYFLVNTAPLSVSSIFQPSASIFFRILSASRHFFSFRNFSLSADNFFTGEGTGNFLFFPRIPKILLASWKKEIIAMTQSLLIKFLSMSLFISLIILNIEEIALGVLKSSSKKR